MDLKFEISTICCLLAARQVTTLLRRVLSPLLVSPHVYCLELATGEICANLAKHGNRDNAEASPLLVRLELDQDTARLTIVDHGSPYDPRVFRRPRFDPADPESLPVGGMGLPLVHDTLDAIDYRSQDGMNTVTLVKKVRRISDANAGAPARRDDDSNRPSEGSAGASRLGASPAPPESHGPEGGAAKR